ncbi:DEAD-box ATP-dependent RNA helicase 13-like [Malus sylvestris]|uniref:DEAD-box ATP-dependent RNA helicase 13-like n=1 Tax=Malus sylvestris TaxID=3752 RepID=UPI0021AD3692|nr:DEAD-box ATP-dependent RNA helicase 13-like [Malus sylvestris]
MAPPPLSRGLKRKAKKLKIQKQDAELERFDSLPWNPSLPNDDNAFSQVVGNNELEGGFLMLEEIDEAAYGFEIPEPQVANRNSKEDSKQREKSKKRKRSSGVDGGAGDGVEADGERILGKDDSELNKKKKKKQKQKKKKKPDQAQRIENVDGNGDNEFEDKSKDENVNSKKKRKRKTLTKKKNNAKKTLENVESTVDDDSKGKKEIDKESFDEDEYYAWHELRLHHLIMKSIYRLGFKNPTPIQKACIPAAAHQGKDIVGAAETGSGKTLAFGLPILQRLLDEKEKAVRMFDEKGEEAEKFAPKGLLRALVITPTRELALQVSDHLKAVAKDTDIRVVPIVGGMSKEKQERLLKARPEIVVGTPGRLWELMSGGEKHLVELHSLSFFVLDEADRMIENGHFHEMQSIIDMLPVRNTSTESHSENAQNSVAMSNFQRKKRQTFVFSATIALSPDFRKKLKRSSQKTNQSMSDGVNSIEALSERAGMRDNVSVIDLTNTSILANKLVESFIECREEDKDAYLYYILSVHGQGRTIVFCTSVAALRHISSLLCILGINVWTLHAQMQQRARLKAIDRFRGFEHGLLVATDVAARGLDIPGVRTVVHYQLPHSAEVYVHRSGRTARASADGCSIALIAPNETSKFASLCKSFSKESFQRFPMDSSYMPEVMKRLSLARQIDKIMRKDSQEKSKKNWVERNAELIELVVDHDDSEEERVKSHKQKKASSASLKKLQQELKMLLSRPLQPKSFSHRYLTGAGVSPFLLHQFEELAKQKFGDGSDSGDKKRSKLVVIGQDCVEPLQALRSAGHEVHIDGKEVAQKRRNMVTLRRKRKEEKTRLRDQRRKRKKQMKGGD